MRLINHRYESPEALETVVRESVPADATVLVQLFSGVMDKTAMIPVLRQLAELLPDAVVIGATTAGEIMDGVMSSGSIVIAFSLFEGTEVRSFYFPEAGFERGVEAAQAVLTDRTKACIVFGEGLRGDTESFLEGFDSVRGDVMVAGGNAGDDLTFTRTYVIEGTTIHDDGVVVAALESDVLQVHNAYSLYWTPIGKEMVVTRADKNVIYEIDGRPIEELYSHYLGPETVERVPAGAIEFPLVKIVDGIRVARAPVAKTEEGAFVYAGHFRAGDRVRFAIGNVEEVLNHAADVRDLIAAQPVEATYIYSCSVRKLFFQEQLNYEFGLFNEIAPTAGFFTYGEFFHTSAETQLLNVTTTTLSLSESAGLPEGAGRSARDYHHTMLKSLTHLVNVTQGELDETITFLDQYKMVLDESAIVSKSDAEGRITYVNDAFCTISGYSRSELLGNSHNIVRHPDTPQELFKGLWQTITAGRVWKETFRNRTKGGRDYYIKSVVVPIFDDNGAIVEYIAASTDVTDLVEKEQIIQRQRRDTLTGLKNRTALFEDLQEMAERCGLVLFNIDRFSDINDFFGFETGDKLLRAFAKRFKGLLQSGKLYRITGDEFAYLCTESEFENRCRMDLFDYIGMMEHESFDIGGFGVTVHLSAGVAFAEAGGVYNMAHVALKEAKAQQAKVVFFDDNRDLALKSRNNIVMAETIRAAIEEDRIVPYFQGIIDNATRRIVKYEALIRLIDRDGSVLTPFHFIEHAKKSKLYEQLTRVMVAKTLAFFEAQSCEFSLNLALQDILSETTRDFIYASIERSPAANRLVFEIVESEGIESFDEVAAFIKRVRGCGCKIAIDDFGTGYSNFSYLSRLDVDYLKIDGSLIKNITVSDDQRYIVESILHFARKKGIEVVAEFVEDEAVFEILVGLGVAYSQGYLFSIPRAGI